MGSLLFPPIAPPRFEPRKGQIFSFFLVPDTGYRFDLHLASSQLVKVKVELEEELFIYSLPILLAVIEIAEVMIKIPERVKQEFPEVEWSKVAERAVLEEFRKLATIKLFDELFKHSELTDEDCLRLGREVNRAVRLRIEKEL